MLNTSTPTYDQGQTCTKSFQLPSPYRHNGKTNENSTCGGYTAGRIRICNGFPYKGGNRTKQHAFHKIWKCNEFPVNPCPEERKRYKNREPFETAKPAVTVPWKKWPPPVVPVPVGLKIPVKISPEMLDPCYNEYGGTFALGEDEVGPLLEYKPTETLTRETCLKGVLNTQESESFSVKPTSVIILNPMIDHSYTAVVKVRNNGCFPRRMGVINPKLAAFDIDWGASIGERTLLAPGLSNKIVIKYRPKTMENVSDMLTIIIDDDGAIVVPIIAHASMSPVLEMVEWDVGCSTVGNSRIGNFQIKNTGGTGRFWILTEEEFMNEYLELHGPSQSGHEQDQAIIDKCDRDYFLQIIDKIEQGGEDYEPPAEYFDLKYQQKARHECQKKALREKLKKKLDHLIAHPFRIYPTCFRLQKNQKISVQIRYRPKHPSYHMRKLALLCDNGEMRWVAVKGIGIDPQKFPLLEFKGEWKAPPIDLPTDLSARISIDCGDLLAGEKKLQCFSIYNNSCMPVYFFWCVRRIRSGYGEASSDGASEIMELKRSVEEPSDWREYQNEIKKSTNVNIEPIKVYPSQGILLGRDTIEVTVSMQAPCEDGYYASVLSVFAQQLGDQSEEVLAPLVAKFNMLFANEDPVTYEALVEVLPAKNSNNFQQYHRNHHSDESSPVDLKRHQHHSSLEQLNQEFLHPTLRHQVNHHYLDDHQLHKHHIDQGFNPMYSKQSFNKLQTQNPDSKQPSGDQNPGQQQHHHHSEEGYIDTSRKLESTDNEMQDRAGGDVQIVGEQQLENTSNPHDYRDSLSVKNEHPKGFKSKKFAFPPIPIFYVQDGSPGSKYDFNLIRLLYPPELVNSRRFRKLIDWDDGDSSYGKNREEEEMYREYFGKICTVYGGQTIERKTVADYRFSQDTDRTTSPLSKAAIPWDENEYWSGECEDQLDLRHEHPCERRPNSVDSEEARVRERQTKQKEKLRAQGCKMVAHLEETKLWLESRSPIQPVQEVEIWARVVPLQCSFEPPVIAACGSFPGRTSRDVLFTNNSHHPICLTLEPVVTEVGTIICWPYEAMVDPGTTAEIRFKFQFRRQGVREGRIKGTIKVPFTQDEIPCWISYRIQADGPVVVTLTPLMDFGLMYPGTEHEQTLVLQNCGQLRTKWTVTIPTESMENEEHETLSIPGTKIKQSNTIRVWPEWGTIEPGETVAIQVYVSCGCPQKLSTACEITIEENPDVRIYVAIMADVMLPKVILRDIRLILSEAFKGILNYELCATLQNLTAFPTAFRWCDPIGDQSKYISLIAHPKEGILPPKGVQICQFEFLASTGMVLRNVFVPCCIAGLKEPLIAKLEGTVFSLCLRIVIPRTKLVRIREEDIPWDCKEDMWPYMCGLPDEDPGEDEMAYVSILGHYGLYCQVPMLTPPPPPTATPTETTLVEEEQQQQEEKEEEETEEKSEISSRKKKLKKWKELKSKTQLGKEKSSTAIPKILKSLKALKKLKKKREKSPEMEEEEVDREEEEEEEEAAMEDEYAEMETEAEEMEDPNAIYSSGRLMYFQVSRWGQHSTAKFQVYNDSRLPTNFHFKVVYNPVETKQVEVDGPTFVTLDDEFFESMKHIYAEKVSLLRGKKGCVYNIVPSEGTLKAGDSLDVTVEFLANMHGVYEDILECHFEGIDEPHAISLIGVAVICNKCDTPLPPPDLRPESPDVICVRRLNTLLY